MSAFGDPTRHALIVSMLGQLGRLEDLHVADRPEFPAPRSFAGHTPDLHGVGDERLVLGLALRPVDLDSEHTRSALAAYITMQDSDGLPPTLQVFVAGDHADRAWEMIRDVGGERVHERIRVVTVTNA